MSSDKKIIVAMIIEVLGKPADHLISTLEDIISKMALEKGVSIISKNINQPVEMPTQKGFFTDFAEIEVEISDVANLILLMFKYMPSHLEIISPSDLSIKSFEFNRVLNDLTMRLHKYDEVMRIVQIEKSILEKKLRELLPKEKTEVKEDKN